MKYIELIEAPIQDFEVGDFRDPKGYLAKKSYFKDPDRKLLKNPKFIEKAIKAFEKTPYTFRFFFIDSENLDDFHDRYRDYGQIGVGKLEMLGVDIKPQTNAITIIYSGNFGDNLINFTPWMIAHRVGHAICGIRSSEVENFSNYIAVLKKSIATIFSEDIKNTPFYKKLVVKHNRHNIDLESFSSISDIANIIGTMRSAREKELNTFSELFIEYIAQYLIKGKISFNHFTKETVEQLYKELKLDNSENLSLKLSKVNTIVDDFKINTTMNIKSSLDYAVGKMYIL